MPSASITMVDGIALGGSCPNPSNKAPSGSKILGYVMPELRTNACAGAVVRSRVLRPRNSTSSPTRSYASTSSGASCRQGAHQEPHTFTTTTLPAKSSVEMRSPSSMSDGPSSVGASGRWLRSKMVTVPSPMANPAAPSPDVSPGCADEQAASNSTATPEAIARLTSPPGISRPRSSSAGGRECVRRIRRARGARRGR